MGERGTRRKGTIRLIELIERRERERGAIRLEFLPEEMTIISFVDIDKDIIT